MLQRIALLLLCVAFLSVTPPNIFPQAPEAEQQAREGLQLARSGNFKQAEIELRRAVSLDPQNPAYLADLGGILGMERNLKEAGVYFARALRLDPDSLTIRRDLAANQWQSGELNPARENLERILRRAPDDNPTILLLGMVEADLKNYSRAAQLLSMVPALVEQHPQSIAALARCYYHAGQTQKAQAALMNLASHFRDPQSIFLGGEMAEEAGDAKTAEILFDSIRTTYVDRSRLDYHLAHTQYLSGNWAECQRILLQLIGAGYRTSEAYDLLGQVYSKQNEMTEAAKAFEAAIALSPSAASNYLDFAAVLTDHQLRDSAIQVLTSCVSALPKSFGCFEAKGKAESSQHYYKESTASFRRAAHLKPSSADAESGLATSLAGLGEMREAASSYETAIRLDPHRAMFYRAYGQLLLTEAAHHKGPLTLQAASLLEKAVSLDPSDGEARLLLGQLWFNENKIHRALPLLKAAAHLDPQNARPHYLLWRVYQRLGRNNEAASELATFKKLSLRRHQPHHSAAPRE